MKTPAMIALGTIAVAFAAAAVYFSRKPAAGASNATNNRPVNLLPARAYALYPGAFNPQGQPPAPTFTPFSGFPVVENILRASQQPTAQDASAQPTAEDPIQNVVLTDLANIPSTTSYTF